MMIVSLVKLARSVLMLLSLSLMLTQLAPVCADEIPASPTIKDAAASAVAAPIKDPTMVMKTPPANVVELIENLRDALRSGAVFDEAFYTEENVKKITAARDVEIFRRQENSILKAEAFDFRGIADNLEPSGGGLSVSIQLEIRPDGKKSVIIQGNIRLGQPLLHYLTIEKLVGYPWQVSRPEPWGSNRLYQEPTDPHGNAEREYTHQDGGIEEKGIFKFNPAGYLNSLFLRSGEQ